MINLELVCDIDTAAGYAAHARMMAYAFHLGKIEDKGINIRILPRRKEASVVDTRPEIMAVCQEYANKKFLGKPDVRVFFEPAHFLSYEPGVKTVSFCQWETTRIRNYVVGGKEPTNWVHMMNECAAVMTSSTSAATAYKHSGVEVPVYVNSGPIHDFEEKDELGVAGLVKHAKTGDVIPKKDRPIVIGYMAQWSPRKNIEAFIRDVTIAFNGNKNVVALLKTYRSSHFDSSKQIMEAARVVRNSCRVTTAPDMFMVTDKLTDQEIEQFYNVIDVYYCPSRGEGFNVPAAMAASAGVPVIAGKFGGHADFLHVDMLLPGSFSPCLGMGNYDSNQYWFNVDEMVAINKLRETAAMAFEARKNANAHIEWVERSHHTQKHAMELAGYQVFSDRFAEQVTQIVEQKD